MTGKHFRIHQGFLTIAAWAAVAFGVQAQTVTLEDSLQEVVVTGTGTEHVLKNAPVQTEVISSKMLRNYGGRSIEDILGGLTASFAFNESDMGSGLQMNGLGNNYILILIDGKRIHGDNGGENDLGLIDPNNIERIEIVKGAASALYGSDAIAGVVNIITKKPVSGFLFENTTRGGSYGDFRQHNGLGITWGRLSSYTRFQAQRSDGWQNTSIEDPQQTEYLITDSRNKTANRFGNVQLSERLTFTASKSLEFYAEGSIYRKRIYRPRGTHASVDVNTYDLRYNNASASAGGRWKLNETDVVTLDLEWNRHAYFHDFTAITLADGFDPQGRPTPYYPYFPGDEQLQSDQRRGMAHLKGVFSLPKKNRLSAGAEWRYDWLKAPTRVAGGKVTDNTEAAYVQDEWSLIPWLNITAGLRLNRNQQFGIKLTPKVSAMAKAGDFRFRTSWGQGFKTPTPKELHYQYVRDMNGTYLYLGNEDLKPQTSNYYSIGTEYSRNGLSVSVTGYYNSLKDMIALTTIPNYEAPADLYVQYQPIKTRQYRNLETAKTKGIDVTLRWRIGQEWTVGGGYSYLDTEAHTYDTKHERMHTVIIDGMAHHKANAYATWNHVFTPTYSFGAGVYGRMSSKRYYQLNGDGKGYQLWRVTTSHELKSKYSPVQTKIEVGIDNIFNYVNRSYHGLHLGTNTPGRTFFASVALRFHQGRKTESRIDHSAATRENDEM